MCNPMPSIVFAVFVTLENGDDVVYRYENWESQLMASRNQDTYLEIRHTGVVYSSIPTWEAICLIAR